MVIVRMSINTQSSACGGTVGGFRWKCGICWWYQDQWSAALFRVDLSTTSVFLFPAISICGYQIEINVYTNVWHFCINAVEKMASIGRRYTLSPSWVMMAGCLVIFVKGKVSRKFDQIWSFNFMSVLDEEPCSKVLSNTLSWEIF